MRLRVCERRIFCTALQFTRFEALCFGAPSERNQHILQIVVSKKVFLGDLCIANNKV